VVLDTLLAVLALGLFLVVGLYLLYDSQGLVRDVVAMLVTTTSDAGVVEGGRVEVSGTARPAGESLTDPVTGSDCVAYEHETSQEEYVKDDLLDFTRLGYRQQADGADAVPFYVEDESGQIRVDPGDPADGHRASDGVVNVYAPGTESVHLDEDASLPASLEAYVGRHDMDRHDRARVHESAHVAPGDPVYVLGQATHDGGERVLRGGDGRFVVAGASQARTLVYNAGWALVKFLSGLALTLGSGYLLLAMTPWV